MAGEKIRARLLHLPQGIGHCDELNFEVSMRHPTFLAILLASGSCFAQTQAPDTSSFLTVLQNAPSQIRSKTFDQQAFNTSLDQVKTDATLDLPAACRLLEADLGDSNPVVSSVAAATLRNLMLRKVNTDTDRQLIAAPLLSCVGKSKDQNTQMVCTTFVTDYGTPMTAISQFKEIAGRKITEGTAFPWLAVGLEKVARIWPSVNTDSVLAEFFRSPSVPDTVKAKAIFSLQNEPLSDQVLDAVAELLSTTKSDELKVQIIDVSQKFGGRALDREHNILLALETNLSESENVRSEAGSALRTIPQGDTAIPGIH
jgi:hypothetical protein